MLMLLSLLPGQMRRERTGQPQVLVLCLKQAQHLLLKKKKKKSYRNSDEKERERENVITLDSCLSLCV